jgi:hypothetical protein
MRSKPIYLNILSVFLLLVAMSLPIQVLFIFDYPLSDWPQSFQHLTFLNWLFMGSCAMTSFFLYRGHQKAVLFSAITVFLVFTNNLFVGLYGKDFSLTQSLIGVLFISASLVPIFLNPIRQTLFNSKQQWWRTAPRFAKQLDVQIWAFSGDKPFNVRTLNVSRTGALLQVPTGYPLHHRMPMALYVNEIIPVHCEAKVVRHVSGPNNDFDQVGVEFFPLDKYQTQMLDLCFKT